jgi:hypothetical protein
MLEDLAQASAAELATVQKWRRALERAGLTFIDAMATAGSDVRLKGPSMESERW